MPLLETSIGDLARLIPAQTISSETAWVFASLWGMGALTFLIWQMYCYRRFMRSMEKSSSPIPKDNESAKLLASLKQTLGIKENVQLAYCSIVKSLILVGLLKPIILLPVSDKLDIDLGMVIHHELVHLKRKDLWVKILVLGVSAIHWFNPLDHVLRKDIHTSSELSVMRKS